MPLIRRALPSLIAVLALSGCGLGGDEPYDAVSWRGAPVTTKGLKLPSRATGTHVQLATPAGLQNRFWAGVNLGSTTPGHMPGEVSARAPDYRRWLPEMAALGVRVIRVYTLLDPSFYRELRTYNLAHPAAPLYVIHGVWIPEQRFLASRDLYDAEVMSQQHELTTEVHDAVFGHLHRDPRRGFADGTWDANISQWVIAWSPGIEWDPDAIQASERRNPPRAYRGRYIATRGPATSTEAWIAQTLDELASLDARDGWSRAMTFTNWLTADPLHHPHEPLAGEDAISVDAMHLTAKPAWPGGFFASYHAYPYYPDFLSLEPRYRQAPDSYRAYLDDLRAHHRGQALMVTEFGVPSSLGKAHLGPQGRDQGDHSEQEASSIDAALLTDIHDAGLAGGVLFEWVDEWFKITWNTVDVEQPAERRALWRNPLTNEEHFGVIAAEPGLKDKVVLDGFDSEWTESQHSPVLFEGQGEVRELRATHDPEYLYLRIRTDGPASEADLRVGLDIRPGTNRGLPGLPGVDPGADVALTLSRRTARLDQAAWTDPVAFQYGIGLGYVPVRRSDLRRGSGAWRDPQLMLNRPFVVPVSREPHPAELQNLNPLHWGPQRLDDRSLVASEDEVIEVRLPWSMLGFADPSSRLLVDPRPDGTIATEGLPPGREIGLFIASAEGATLVPTVGYGFEPWQSVQWHERRKAGWASLQSAFTRLAG